MGNALAKGNNHPQSGLPDKDFVVKELVVCWVLRNLIPLDVSTERKDWATCLSLVVGPNVKVKSLLKDNNSNITLLQLFDLP